MASAAVKTYMTKWRKDNHAKVRAHARKTYRKNPDAWHLRSDFDGRAA